jgi:hypothetical protein
MLGAMKTGRRKLLVATAGLATVVYVTCANRPNNVVRADDGSAGQPADQPGAAGQGAIGREQVGGGGGVAPTASTGPIIDHPPGNLPAPPPAGCRGCSM